ncbi:MAG: hypothetical protein F2704_04095 [Actinobacteria bacterium]|uniref:Unannotated protein n=1 Tax=freshwater metagenome TaxID=449393 RepID=A0A6J7IEA0_9ZZZZ|nr:DMT family transporter [Actinomycetota bacterium]MSW47842.1 hypothetical protein [Actinomycetota bacterium]MSX25320.1 hypothetical protein [Actinomycetota bacterium]MSY46095.1 hypothetical protein [Actinomycetota bacterium]MSY57436.1 hypothetical protein [Actinomycetota bacterium]
MRLDLLAILSGVMIALQARTNGELSSRLDNGLEAALVSFGSGLILITLASLFIPGIKTGAVKLRSAVRAKSLPAWRLLAGMLGGSFVAIQTQMVPLIGVAIYSVASIAGQTVASLGVDRLGMTGGGKKHITFRRVLAAGFTILAVLLSVLDRIDARNLSLYAVSLAGLAGAIVGFQRAFNGQINEFTEQSFTTSLLNFITGTTFLLFFSILGILTHRTHFVSLPFGPWWIYTGGAIGVVYIAFSSTIVQHLGVLTFTLLSVGGQLVGSLLIDYFAPTASVHISWYLVTGILMTYFGVLVGGTNHLRLARK